VPAPGRDAEAVQGRQERGEGTFPEPLVTGEEKLPPADGGYPGEDPHGRPVVSQIDLPTGVFQAAAGAAYQQSVVLGGDDGPQRLQGRD